MKHAAKRANDPGPAAKSSACPGISAADAAGLQDDASWELCKAMGELGIMPEVCNKVSTLLMQRDQELHNRSTFGIFACEQHAVQSARKRRAS